MQLLNQLNGANKIVTDANNRFVSDTEKAAITHANRTVLDLLSDSGGHLAYNGSALAIGDMLAEIYDPQNKGADAFNRANHTGTQTASTISDLVTTIIANAPAETTTTVGALVNNAVAKTTPIDADLFPLVDSAGGNVIKKVSLANLKTVLNSGANPDIDEVIYKAKLIQSTGLIYGGDLSINNNDTKFNVAAGMGYIVDNFTDAANPVVTKVQWVADTALTTPYLSTDPVTYVRVNSSGVIETQSAVPTEVERRDYIYLGYLQHEAGTAIELVKMDPYVTTDISNQLQDFLLSFGAFNIEGNIYMNASTNLTVKRTAGKTFTANENYNVSKKSPHIIITNEESPAQLHYYYRDATGTWVNDVALTTNVDPNNYDTGLGLAAVPAGKWTIQALAYYAQTESNDFQYGQVIYDTYAAAKSAIQDSIVINPYNDFDTFRGWLVVKQGATNLSDITQAEFIPAGKLGMMDVSSGGGMGGEVNTGSNVGTGAGVFKDKSGVDLRFRRVKAGTNITVTENTDDITLDVTLPNSMPLSGGTFTGQAKAQSNTAYTTAQIRNVRFKQGIADFTTAELLPGEMGFLYT